MPPDVTHRPASSAFSPANLPYWVAIVLAGSGLVWFMMTQNPFSTTAASSDGTSTTTNGNRSTTIPADGEATNTTGGSTAVTTTSSVALPDDPLQSLAFETITTELVGPTYAAVAPGDDAIYVLERRGIIKRVDPGTGEVSTVLDIVDKSNADKGLELGLLGMAFHPDFASNRRFWIYYTDIEHDTRVVEYTMGADGIPEPSSEKLVMEIDRLPNALRHNGGMMQFGPDGYLYIASGDNAQYEVNPQDPSTKMGAILRIDVDSGDPYAAPSDNPWADGSGAPEVWAIGLRNPWRFYIDAPENLIYVADVGQNAWEEVNAVPLEPAGYNFGWPHLEASSCWSPGTGCESDGTVLPVVEYGHDEGCAVTGGVVYRGSDLPELIGHYFFSDWCNGWIRSFRVEDGVAGEVTEWTELSSVGQVTSFGIDADNEILIVTTEGLLARLGPVR
ncbi:MAG: PQQ-dependent sugar dehydrogenase [Acidimicrobiia bacterium]|nr:PQQ-dependent sugar dehydrogenase [Acidimicrobiia bacterium]